MCVKEMLSGQDFAIHHKGIADSLGVLPLRWTYFTWHLQLVAVASKEYFWLQHDRNVHHGCQVRSKGS